MQSNPLNTERGIAGLLARREMRELELKKTPYGRQGAWTAKLARKVVRLGIEQLVGEYQSLVQAVNHPENRTLKSDLEAFVQERRFAIVLRREVTDFRTSHTPPTMKERIRGKR